MAIALHTFFLQLILFFLASSLAEANNPRKIYLVQMKVGEHRYGSSSGHKELLGEVLDDDSTVANALIYSYSESFTGFSASLTQNERQKLKRRREVLEVSHSRNLKPHTTRSWDFMNLTLAAKRNPQAESDLVVAVIDSGIWPYSELFSSDSPPPLAWQDKCENITCNNKIVGARSYYLEKEHYNVAEEKSVIDVDGHGTHVASIVAGKEIEKASYFGLAEGTMRGGVPNAKISVYKTCWKIINKEDLSCPEHKVLEAIEDAIKDKVDIISYSQGGQKPIPIHKDLVSWAFLRALEKGILTSTVAGNSGMEPYTIINGAPWVMTVAASLKDRLFKTKLELEGDKSIFVYDTINTFETQDSFYPLLDETAPHESTRKRELVAESNDAPILSNHRNGKRKNVFFNYSQSTILDKVFKERPQGAIIWDNFSERVGMRKLQFPIASIVLDKIRGSMLRKDFSENERNISVKIHKTVEVPAEDGEEATIADMSSRGPNCDRFLANILKPDIAAPGLDIIAGWPENVNLLPKEESDYRHLRFNILSGTSMACPHATGLALYIKSFYPSWSPSAIKSALMTTSTEMEGNEFECGSGRLNATNVLDPGLIYETRHLDYIDYMCKQGYKTQMLRSHVGSDKISCSGTKTDLNADLNYPTMTAQVEINTKFTKVFYRTVTNVGAPDSTYLGEIKFQYEKNFDAEITVEPKRLHFDKLGDTKTFTVTVTGESKPNINYKNSFMTENTWLTWTEMDGSRQVRSPIVIYSITKSYPACRKFHKN
ncbi:unnamed protein product [Eruca vesicaria subsp. sativa]|uniref:Uncharacterized protein n=1 Tax=Eruca vesicaria subsp. sativa TaxID=29727 RepID=A0ABC8KV03_ERUVS|nr:unnamed protein product [Eruca vesicaria subsp. sativa]